MGKSVCRASLVLMRAASSTPPPSLTPWSMTSNSMLRPNDCCERRTAMASLLLWALNTSSPMARNSPAMASKEGESSPASSARRSNSRSLMLVENGCSSAQGRRRLNEMVLPPVGLDCTIRSPPIRWSKRLAMVKLYRRASRLAGKSSAAGRSPEWVWRYSVLKSFSMPEISNRIESSDAACVLTVSRSTDCGVASCALHNSSINVCLSRRASPLTKRGSSGLTLTSVEDARPSSNSSARWVAFSTRA